MALGNWWDIKGKEDAMKQAAHFMAKNEWMTQKEDSGHTVP